MPEHEEKRCPRCNGPFTCMAGNIASCQCSAVELNAQQRRYMAERYHDCLCAACLSAERSASAPYNDQQPDRPLSGR